MTGNRFRPDAVARAKALIKAGLDPQAVRVRIFHEYPELTGFGLDRVLGIAREEIAEQDRKREGRQGQ